MKLNKILEKFEGFCNPRKNITMLRHKFFTYRQSEGRKFFHFVTELRKLSDECEFDAFKAKAVKLGQAAEDTKQYVKELRHEASS